MRTTAGLLSLIWLGGIALPDIVAPASAQGVSSASTSSGAAADTKTGASASREGSKSRSGRRKQAGGQPKAGGGSIERPRCVDLWEPATHMTKAQWERACRGLDGRL